MSRFLRWTASSGAVVILAAAALAGPAQKAVGAFPDEPEAHALYDRIVQTMRDAKSLSWVPTGFGCIFRLASVVLPGVAVRCPPLGQNPQVDRAHETVTVVQESWSLSIETASASFVDSGLGRAYPLDWAPGKLEASSHLKIVESDESPSASSQRSTRRTYEEAKGELRLDSEHSSPKSITLSYGSRLTWRPVIIEGGDGLSPGRVRLADGDLVPTLRGIDQLELSRWTDPWCALKSPLPDDTPWTVGWESVRAGTSARVVPMQCISMNASVPSDSLEAELAVAISVILNRAPFDLPCSEGQSFAGTQWGTIQKESAEEWSVKLSPGVQESGEFNLDSLRDLVESDAPDARVWRFKVGRCHQDYQGVGTVSRKINGDSLTSSLDIEGDAELKLDLSCVYYGWGSAYPFEGGRYNIVLKGQHRLKIVFESSK